MKSLCFAIICHLSHSFFFFFFYDMHWQTRSRVGSLFGFLEETCSEETVQSVRCACVWTLGLFPTVWLSWMARSESDADFFHRHELHPSIQFLCTRILSLIQQYRHLLLMSFGYVCMMWLEICESCDQQWITCKLLCDDRTVAMRWVPVKGEILSDVWSLKSSKILLKGLSIRRVKSNKKL